MKDNNPSTLDMISAVVPSFRAFVQNHDIEEIAAEELKTIHQLETLFKEGIAEGIRRELLDIRATYDRMEMNDNRNEVVDYHESPPQKFVTWRGWKMIRNVITDRLEELTGNRQGQAPRRDAKECTCPLDGVATPTSSVRKIWLDPDCPVHGNQKDNPPKK